MADKKSDQQDTGRAEALSATADKKKKRQLKAAPVTLREQSELAQAKSGQSSRRSSAGRILGAPFRAVGRVFRPLGKFKFVRAIGYVFAPPYLRNAFRELRLVTWPTGKQSRQLTFAVIVFSLVFGVLAAITDYGLDKLFRAVILKQ